MNAAEVIRHLKEHIAPPAFCFLEQVADGTGARQHRWADAVAMSVWPSRGYSIHGIEVKVSRSDWLSELKDVTKSSAVQQYCDYWYVATPDESIIRPGEMPDNWGWMICKAKGIKVVKAAPRLKPQPLTIEFVASILRNFAKADETVVERRIYDACQKAREEASSYAQRDLAELKKVVSDFESASGIQLQRWTDGKELGEAVATLKGLKWQVERIESAIAACVSIGTMLGQVKELASLRDDVVK